MLVNGRSHLALLNGPVVAERREAAASLRGVGRWFCRKFFGEALHPAPRPPHDLGVLVGHVVLLLGVAPQVVKGGQYIGRSGAIASSRSPPPRLCASSRVAPQLCPRPRLYACVGSFCRPDKASVSCRRFARRPVRALRFEPLGRVNETGADVLLGTRRPNGHKPRYRLASRKGNPTRLVRQ